MEDNFETRIIIDSKVMAGKPVIKGTRIPVELVVRMLGQGISQEEILNEYPRLQPEDISASLLYAAHVISLEDVFPVSLAA